ncbi:MAG: NUDIX hydrolase [Lachnospiraceae bacterium]
MEGKIDKVSEKDQQRPAAKEYDKEIEVWDAYDASFAKIEGKKLMRGEPIPPGVFHLVCDILVKHTDDTYLLMERDVRKPYGGMWEASAGGSALAGETPLQCAVRELREETGIQSDDLIELGEEIDAGTHAVYVEFLCITDGNKNEISLQDGETTAYKWVTRQELLSMKEEELVTERMQKYINELYEQGT